MSKRKAIYIRWTDAKGIAGDWEFTADMKSMLPCECESVGYLLEETAKYVTFCQTVTPNENEEGSQVLGRMTVPRCSILKMKKIKL